MWARDGQGPVGSSPRPRASQIWRASAPPRPTSACGIAAQGPLGRRLPPRSGGPPRLWGRQRPPRPTRACGIAKGLRASEADKGLWDSQGPLGRRLPPRSGGPPRLWGCSGLPDLAGLWADNGLWGGGPRRAEGRTRACGADKRLWDGAGLRGRQRPVGWRRVERGAHGQGPVGLRACGIAAATGLWASGVVAGRGTDKGLRGRQAPVG